VQPKRPMAISCQSGRGLLLISAPLRLLLQRDDILLEYYSNYERRTLGWIAKDLACDLIA
jgi:hypothetical protein